MNPVGILNHIIYSSLFILALAFAYYLVQNSRIMKDSAGRQIMAFGSIFFIIAILIKIINYLFIPYSNMAHSAFLLWTISAFSIIYGWALVSREIQKAYNIRLYRVAIEHVGSKYSLIGLFTLIFVMLPLYIYFLVYHISDTWSNITINSTWVFVLCNLTMSARMQYQYAIKPHLEEWKPLLSKDEVSVMEAYAVLINRFLLAANIFTDRFKKVMINFFENNPILFENCTFNQDGTINFGTVSQKIDRIHDVNRSQDICIMFSALASKVLNLYGTLTSPKHAELILADSYRALRQLYGDSPFIFEILRSLPEGVLENEKIALLPRRELEASVEQRTKELEDSKNYINSVVENITDMLIVIDQDGRIKSINKTTKELLGYTERDLIDQHINIILDSGGSFKFGSEKFNKLINDGHIRNIETAYLSREHGEIPVLFSGSVMRNEYDEIEGIVCVAQDIAELKRAQEILEESEEKHRMVVENANEGIMVIQNGIFKFANPKVKNIIGNFEEGMIYKRFLDLIHPDDRQSVLEKYEESLSGKEINLHPFRIIDNNGSTKWMEASAIKIDWEGKPASLIFINDITERRNIEEELLRAQKLETVGVLAGGIAHDFNNFLLGIDGYLSIAKNLLDPSHRAYEKILDAEKASERAADLTKQLLTFAKGGEPVLKTESIGDIVIDSSNLGLSGSNVKCDFLIADNLWNADVDKGQISQVINNLVINAKQAMADGGILEVRAENKILVEGNELSLKPGPYVKISVEDQGIGIPDKILPRIFDPFFTTKAKGNGLGLAITYSIIKKHQGDIRVESIVGVGTKFHIHLPAAPDKELRKAETKKQKLIIGKGKVLLMDDEDYIRDVISKMLQSLGYEVMIAEDGVETIESYKEAKQLGRPFDVVIMDLTIPGGMGGREAIRRLREMDPKVRAIVTSGYSNDTIMSNFESYGFSGVIAKPYKMAELSETIHKVIAN